MPASPFDASHSYESDHGYFVDSEDSDDGLVEIEAEDPKKYQAGLYFPVCIGDYMADNRYRVVHKLGHGAFSTVWLAHDISTKKDVALKIMVPGDAAEHELRAQKEIKRTVKDVSKLVLFTDDFFIRDYNDRDHHVLVFPVRGPALSATGLAIPRATRMLVVKQFLEGLESLHGGGFIHGDLNDNNVMWGMIPLDDHDTTAKYKRLGRPQKVALQQLQELAELVRPIRIPTSLLTDRIYLGDFGLATRMGIQVSTIGPMPQQWKNLREASKESWYDQDMEFDFKRRMEYFFDCLTPDADAVERNYMISIMAKGFRYLPEERPTATQLLQDPSFQELMRFYS